MLRNKIANWKEKLCHLQEKQHGLLPNCLCCESVNSSLRNTFGNDLSMLLVYPNLFLHLPVISTDCVFFEYCKINSSIPKYFHNKDAISGASAKFPVEKNCKLHREVWPKSLPPLLPSKVLLGAVS